MTSMEWAILLFVIGGVLLLGEFLLPTHGLLGALGGGAALGGVVACFAIDRWLGLAVLAGLTLLTPLLGALAVKLWPHTPLGRRMILAPVRETAPLPTVMVGQEGMTISELRPIGVCQFGQERVEACSDRGLLPPGTAVRVVQVENQRPVVRAIPREV